MSLRRDLERAAREREDSAARERSWHVVRAAYEQLEPGPRRWPWRAFVATALLAVVGAAGVAAASAPRSDVGRFVRGVLGVGEPRARPALVRVPGGCSLRRATARGSSPPTARSGASAPTRARRGHRTGSSRPSGAGAS